MTLAESIKVISSVILFIILYKDYKALKRIDKQMDRRIEKERKDKERLEQINKND